MHLIKHMKIGMSFGADEISVKKLNDVDAEIIILTELRLFLNARKNTKSLSSAQKSVNKENKDFKS